LAGGGEFPYEDDGKKVYWRIEVAETLAESELRLGQAFRFPKWKSKDFLYQRKEKE
jgi:hypothetical protein